MSQENKSPAVLSYHRINDYSKSMVSDTKLATKLNNSPAKPQSVLSNYYSSKLTTPPTKLKIPGAPRKQQNFFKSYKDSQQYHKFEPRSILDIKISGLYISTPKKPVQ
jgi:hypothetical protein